MFNQFKEQLKNQNIDLEAIMANLDMHHLKSGLADSVRSTLQSLEPAQKEELKTWIAEVKHIKRDKDLNATTREARFNEINTSETVTHLLKSVVTILAKKIPVKNENLLHAGESALNKIGALLSLEFGGVATILLKKTLPKILNSSKFDPVLELIDSEIGTKREEEEFDVTNSSSSASEEDDDKSV